MTSIRLYLAKIIDLFFVCFCFLFIIPELKVGKLHKNKTVW